MTTFKVLKIDDKCSVDDWNRACDYLRSKGMYPTEAETLFVAYDDVFNIVGVCGFKRVTQIEPFVIEEGHSLVGQVLAEKALTLASMIGNSAMVMVKQSKENWISILERYGFVVTDREMAILKKKV